MAAHPALLGEPLPVELMNTTHTDRNTEVYDLIADPAQAALWVEAISPRLPPAAGHPQPATAALDDQDVQRLQTLRNALRSLAAEITQAPPPFTTTPTTPRQEAIETVNRLSSGAHIWPVLTWPQTEEEPTATFSTHATTGDYVVSSLARQASELFTGPQHARLRACLAPGCDRYFIKDHSRREWCTRACGNRARVARHYRRHHPDTLRTSAANTPPTSNDTASDRH